MKFTLWPHNTISFLLRLFCVEGSLYTFIFSFPAMLRDCHSLLNISSQPTSSAAHRSHELFRHLSRLSHKVKTHWSWKSLSTLTAHSIWYLLFYMPHLIFFGQYFSLWFQRLSISILEHIISAFIFFWRSYHFNAFYSKVSPYYNLKRFISLEIQFLSFIPFISGFIDIITHYFCIILPTAILVASLHFRHYYCLAHFRSSNFGLLSRRNFSLLITFSIFIFKWLFLILFNELNIYFINFRSISFSLFQEHYYRFADLDYALLPFYYTHGLSSLTIESLAEVTCFLSITQNSPLFFTILSFFRCWLELFGFWLGFCALL